MLKEITKIEPCADVVGRLETLLQEAKNGDIRSLVYVVTYVGVATGNGFCGLENRGNLTTAIGELEFLKQRIMRLDDEEI